MSKQGLSKEKPLVQGQAEGGQPGTATELSSRIYNMQYAVTWETGKNVSPSLTTWG